MHCDVATLSSDTKNCSCGSCAARIARPLDSLAGTKGGMEGDAHPCIERIERRRAILLQGLPRYRVPMWRDRTSVWRLLSMSIHESEHRGQAEGGPDLG